MRNTGLVLRMVAVLLVGLVMAAAVLVVLGTAQFRPTVSVGADFEDVSGLESGSDVRAAGVRIGEVTDLEVQPDNTIRVGFTVAEEVPVTTGTTATVRYQNLVGDRYIELGRAPGERLAAGGILPVAQTTPALDLDELYNGFSPLFQGLEPQEINELTGSLIGVFQGQAGAVEGLLAKVGSLTNGLADRDQLIGQLVTNLNTVLDTANRRAPELSDLVVQLQNLISRFAAEREPLGQGIARVNALAGTVADVVPRLRPELKGTIYQLDRLAGVINNDTALLDDQLRRAPGYYNAVGRVGLYSSAFNFYLCGVQLRFPNGTPEGIVTPIYPELTDERDGGGESGFQGAARCQY